ncbi:lipoprotein [Tamlana sedimentorum]|uniref:Lipoprotein n=2 Tax=Neotamlana sedimentorum TaxID=1435349 RepID=A0A0D7WHU6_9FLAO|nr:lipoprotein [Tamlana sedimentorum]
MKNYIELIELSDASNQSKVAVSAALQGRVMTSSADGKSGRSYGWINRELFESEEIQEHINVYGGEERFWLGPEGGQYSIFFEKGAEFTLDDWYTPKLIDLEPFDVKNVSATSATFTKKASLKNYSGFQFDMEIEREVAILSKDDIQKQLNLSELSNQLKTVAYQTKNTLTNIGTKDWKKDSGLLSIWLLGMFNHSPNTTILIPYVQGDDAALGKVVNDTYFGKVPADRLVVKGNAIFFKGDGEYRSKIGLTPMRAKDIAGSYDSANGILTIVKYNKPKNVTDYVNSMWEIQEEPFSGDVINAYNDGAPEPGAKPLGPFYELETSSPALALKAGESGTHIQTTYHIEGDEITLNPLVKELFGVSINDIKTAFN